LKIFQSRIGLRWLILVAHSGRAGTSGSSIELTPIVEPGSRTGRKTGRPSLGRSLAHASLLYRAHPIARSERWPAALRLPRFSPNSCPTSMQLFIYFSDFKNIK